MLFRKLRYRLKKRTQIFILVAVFGSSFPLQNFIEKKIFDSLSSRLNFSSSEEYLVVPGSIVDGDTFSVRYQNEALTIRLCGVDAPEISQNLGIEARNALINILQSNNYRVEIQPIERDRYNRMVAIIKVGHGSDRKDVSQILVKKGLAWNYYQHITNCSNTPSLIAAEIEARIAKRGVHNQSNPIKPWDYRKKSSWR